jgi:hypothetical protein
MKNLKDILKANIGDIVGAISLVGACYLLLFVGLIYG